MRHFEYVGPSEIKARAIQSPSGAAIISHESLLRWLRELGEDIADEGGWATYVVDITGKLLVAPRRTEHVACASGGPVLAAGEICFTPSGCVVEVTNNSTGYCPAEDCWPNVQRALDAADLQRPPGFTFVAHFRLCPGCGERNLVKDAWYQCALCDADLPVAWNFEL